MDTIFLYWDKHSNDIIISLVTGLITSGTFLWILFLFRPNISICDTIGFDIKEDGTKRYLIKVINRTRNKIFDVKAEVHLLQPINVEGGTNYRWKKLKLVKDTNICINRFDTKDKDASYAMIYVVSDDLEEIWKEPSSRINFTIVARHNVSGFGKVFSKDYYTKASIKKGTFCFGNTFKISSIV